MAPKQRKAAERKVYDYSKIEKGMKVQAESEGVHYAAEVLQVSTAKNRRGAPVKISYKGYEGYDEWLGGDRLRSKAITVVKAEVQGKKLPEPTITVGIMSTSAIVDKVLPGLKKYCKVVGVASRDAARAQEFCDARSCGEGMTNAQMVERADIDFVYNPLPSGVRNDWTAKLIAAGKHVYMEKPMGGSSDDIKKLIAAAEEKKVQWMDGTMWYHSHRAKAIEAKIKSGAIGEVRRITAAFTWPAPDDEWLNGGNGRTDKTREPQGMLGDSGWYPISAVLLGYGWDLPERVMATHTKFNKVDTIIECSATLWFSGGRMAVIETAATYCHRSQFEIVGTEGLIRVDDLVGGQGRSGNFAAYEKPYVGSGTYVLGDKSGKDIRIKVKVCDHVDRLVEDFVNCVTAIKEGGAPDADWPQRSLAVHTVLEAIFESATKGGTAVTL